MTHTHDCHLCTYLGEFDYNGRRMDLYACRHTHYVDFIARYGDEGSEYYCYEWSVGSKDFSSSPWHVECRRRYRTLRGWLATRYLVELMPMIASAGILSLVFGNVFVSWMVLILFVVGGILFREYNSKIRWSVS